MHTKENVLPNEYIMYSVLFQGFLNLNTHEKYGDLTEIPILILRSRMRLRFCFLDKLSCDAHAGGLEIILFE